MTHEELSARAVRGHDTNLIASTPLGLLILRINGKMNKKPIDQHKHLVDVGSLVHEDNRVIADAYLHYAVILPSLLLLPPLCYPAFTPLLRTRLGILC